MEFIDLKKQYELFKNEIDVKINEVLNGSHFIMGPEVEEFEKKLAEYVGVKHAVSCGSGTDALQLIFMAYGIGKGDAIFCPDMTFIASVEPACLLGAKPIFCDIDYKTYNISPEFLELSINEVLKKGVYKPKAIVAVDFLGNPADYELLNEIAEKYNLLLIEDAAQGMGASYKGKKCGSFGNIAATSFFPTKPLGCYGDGGAVFTNDDGMEILLKSLRVHGKGKNKYDNIRIGINSRLDTLQAAILLVKLAHLEDEINLRQKIAGYYDSELKDYLQIPYIEEDCIASYAQYSVLAENTKERDLLRDELKKEGIPTILYYPTPMQKLPVFSKEDYLPCEGKNTDLYCEKSFAIPFSPYLEREQQEKIVRVIQRTAKRR